MCIRDRSTVRRTNASAASWAVSSAPISADWPASSGARPVSSLARKSPGPIGTGLHPLRAASTHSACRGCRSPCPVSHSADLPRTACDQPRRSPSRISRRRLGKSCRSCASRVGHRLRAMSFLHAYTGESIEAKYSKSVAAACSSPLSIRLKYSAKALA